MNIDPVFNQWLCDLAGMRDVLRRLKIAVVSGGFTNEREISIISGKSIYETLKYNSYDVDFIELTDENRRRINLTSYDFLFPSLHGASGEDGAFAGYSEMLGIPYFGESIMTAAIGMNKHFFKQICRHIGIPTADSVLATSDSPIPTEAAIAALGDNVVLKPNTEGSSVGIEFANSPTQALALLKSLLEKFDEVLVESVFNGIELTAPTMGSNPCVVLPLVSIKPKEGYYSYENKYTAGKTEYQCPADVSSLLVDRLTADVKKVHKYLNGSVLVRYDFIWNPNTDNYIMLEMNTIPGFTELSLAPRSAKEAGADYITYLELLMWLSIKRHKMC